MPTAIRVLGPHRSPLVWSHCSFVFLCLSSSAAFGTHDQVAPVHHISNGILSLCVPLLFQCRFIVQRDNGLYNQKLASRHVHEKTLCGGCRREHYNIRGPGQGPPIVGLTSRAVPVKSEALCKKCQLVLHVVIDPSVGEPVLLFIIGAHAFLLICQLDFA